MGEVSTPGAVAPGSSRRSRRAGVIAAWVVSALVVLAVAAWFVVPPVAASLSQSTADGVTPFALGDDAVVVVPTDWTVRPALPWEPAGITVITPDGGLTATLVPEEGAPDVVFAAASDDGAAPAGVTPLTETLGSGLTAVHVIADDRLLAAVGDADTAVRVTAAADGVDVYLPAVAALLEGVGVR